MKYKKNNLNYKISSKKVSEKEETKIKINLIDYINENIVIEHKSKRVKK
jgi:hypothetical protein